MAHKRLKVALVHDFLIQNGGAERVLEALSELFPNAPIYTLVADRTRAAHRYAEGRIITSWLQRLPWSTRTYQWYLPLMPRAIESFDLSPYDLVIASSSAFAKGVMTLPKTLFLCYCHTPTRYLWTDTHTYVKDLRLNPIIKRFVTIELSRLRMWDYLSAQRPDLFIANSNNVKKRIEKYYHRPSEVVYPPVDVSYFGVRKGTENYFLAGGRLVPYKRFDMVIDAFNRLGIPLKIFGEGPLLDALKKRAKKNISFVGWVGKEVLRKLYAESRAFINPQDEDFGITMVEALASGRPVIAFKSGGALEIIEEGKNGVFFDEQTWESLADTVVRFKGEAFDSEAIASSAARFSNDVFKKELSDIIEKKLSSYARQNRD